MCPQFCVALNRCQLQAARCLPGPSILAGFLSASSEVSGQYVKEVDRFLKHFPTFSIHYIHTASQHSQPVLYLTTGCTARASASAGTKRLFLGDCAHAGPGTHPASC